jgi:hypothetical protein
MKLDTLLRITGASSLSKLRKSEHL